MTARRAGPDRRTGVVMRMNHENGGFDCPGCAAGYRPELNVLCAIGDYSTQSDQPIMKRLKVTVTRATRR
ncbi:hypothetical protein [Kitasatospora sp. NPDC001095]